MVNDEEYSQPRNLSLEQAHEMRRYNAIIALQEQVRKLIMKLEQVRGSECWAPHRWEFGVNPVDSTYSSSHDDHEHWGVRGWGLFKDDLSGFKIEASEFGGNLKSGNYIDWVQAIERNIKLKEYNNGKAFKLAILKLKGYASLWYETLNKG